jgi:hypothetical protein
MCTSVAQLNASPLIRKLIIPASTLKMVSRPKSTGILGSPNNDGQPFAGQLFPECTGQKPEQISQQRHRFKKQAHPE